MPNLSVLDESDRSLELTSALAGGEKNILLLPVFTKCHMSCPLMVKALAQVWSNGSQLRVALLSFDASETVQSLREFREREKIPSSWQIFRSSDAAALRAFFDAFSYSIMAADGGFNHPNQILVFDRDLKWSGSLYGTQLTESDLKEAQGTGSRFAGLLAHPDRLAIIGMIGLLLSLFYIFKEQAIFAHKSP